MSEPRLRTVDETMAYIRAMCANEGVSTALIQTGELIALCDEIDSLREDLDGWRNDSPRE